MTEMLKLKHGMVDNPDQNSLDDFEYLEEPYYGPLFPKTHMTSIIVHEYSGSLNKPLGEVINKRETRNRLPHLFIDHPLMTLGFIGIVSSFFYGTITMVREKKNYLNYKYQAYRVSAQAFTVFAALYYSFYGIHGTRNTIKKPIE